MSERFENNKKGRSARKYFIEAEKKYKQNIPTKLPVLDYLKIAVKELEEKEIIIKERDQQIELMKPAIQFLENIFKSRLNHLSVADLFKHH